MSRFRHTQNLSTIKFDKTITMYCPLGEEHYTAKVIVEICPKEWLMDYLDVERFFKQTQGLSLIIEDLVDKVYNYLYEQCEPRYLSVTVEASNAAHFPVTIMKETEI